MFEVADLMLSQLATLIPFILALYILFDLLGSLLFGKR